MNKSLKLNISVNGHYLRVAILFIIYFILVLRSKGYFVGAEGVESVRDAIFELIKRFAIGIPMSIINILPVLVSVIIIILSALDKPVKKLFLATMILLVAYHIFYFLLSIGSFTLSWQFLASTFLYLFIFIYFIIGNEGKAKARKPMFVFDFDFQISKYNISVAGVMIILFVLTAMSPMVVIGDGTEFVLLGLGEAGRLNETVGSVSKLLEDLLIGLKGFTNIVAFYFKIPLLIVLIIQIIKLFKNKDVLYTMPKHLLVLGFLTYAGLPYFINIDQLGGVLSINIIFTLLLLLLLGWFITELIFIKEIDQELKMIGTAEALNFNSFVNGVKNSKFSLHKIVSIGRKIPFLKKKFASYEDDPQMEQ